MKKYKDLIIHCGSDEAALLGLVAIEERCNGKPFSYSEEVEKMYDANDYLLHILVEIPETPSAILLVFANDAKIKVINIVPFQHSCDHIEKNIYNHIVDTFNDKVITPLFSGKYIIDCTKEEVAIQDIIPKSFQELNRWVTCPGAPNCPFSHSNDLHRWFDFICALHTNGEELSSGDLEQWLQDENGWDEDVVTDTIIRYQTERDLLNYYDSHYGRN